MEWWVKLYRKLLDNPISSNILLLWLRTYILLNATYKDREFYLWTNKILLKKWQICFSQKKRAKEFKISTGALHKYLSVLSTEDFIETKWHNKYTILTVLNWNKYQEEWTQNEHKMNTEWTQCETYKKGKKEKKENILLEDEKKTTYLQELESFVSEWNNVWKLGIARLALPRTKKINDALKKVRIKKRKEYEIKEIREWVNNYCIFITNLKKDDNDYYKHRFDLYSFLKQANWLDKFFNQ